MNIALQTMYTENIADLAEITINLNKKEYCLKHNYDLFVSSFYPPVFNNSGFEKIRIIRDLLNNEKYDYVYWCGSDTMITNFKIKIQDLIDDHNHFFIARDVWDINADSFICKNSIRCINFLNDVLKMYDKYVDIFGKAKTYGRFLPDGNECAWAEQQAIIDLLPKYSDIIKIFPQKKMNSYMYHLYNSSFHQKGLDYNGDNGAWSAGDFLVHWPGLLNNIRIELAKEILKFVIK